MKKVNRILATIFIAFMGIGSSWLVISSSVSAAPCRPAGSFLGFPTWYKYLDRESIEDTSTGATLCQPKLSSINDIWKIVASVLEILLRLASLIAIGFVVFGGVTYILSQGSPDKTKQALSTIISAIVGLVITIIAATIVSFVAGSFSNTAAPTSTPNTNQNGPR